MRPGARSARAWCFGLAPGAAARSAAPALARAPLVLPRHGHGVRRGVTHCARRGPLGTLPWRAAGSRLVARRAWRAAGSRPAPPAWPGARSGAPAWRGPAPARATCSLAARSGHGGHGARGQLDRCCCYYHYYLLDFIFVLRIEHRWIT
jgi:hypothetical protein